MVRSEMMSILSADTIYRSGAIADHTRSVMATMCKFGG